MRTGGGITPFHMVVHVEPRRKKICLSVEAVVRMIMVRNVRCVSLLEGFFFAKGEC